MKTDQRNSIFIRCCYGYAVSGMAVLVIGAILPSIIKEAGISFLAAGGLLSIMAIGNLSSSFIFPVMVSIMGKKKSITMVTLFVPSSLLVLSLLPPLSVMYAVILLYGFARGCITILNNAAVNDIYGDAATSKLNILHCSFAIGAFLAPLITAAMMKLGFGWKVTLYMIVILTIFSAISYGTMNYQLIGDRKSKSSSTVAGNRGFLRSFPFYCIAFILFFYLGVENCINGWFVTYLQNTGVMSAEFATTLVSLTWLVIMGGRLVCAAMSKKMHRSTILLIHSIGSAVCLFILIKVNSLPLVTISLLGLGYFLSGIYPTCIANAGPLIQGSTFGMSLLTAISAMGGIFTPQIVGGAADRVGIVAAISILIFNVVFVVILSAVNFKIWHQKKNAGQTS
ncbi:MULTISPECIES: MFS transporter [Lacrimispora]|jgi:fucose permease|uniref:MFS transporter n=1 Tax=Lacrimispora TaxID=2719231 RepID=UPI000BE3A1E6|nr:MFS transporter [Lacrimispora amygdalina]MDK2964729.1 transporter, family, glucose/mannose:H+ symporter [Lacrimispora sp.]